MISDKKMELLLELAAAGKSIRTMAKMAGVSKQTAQNYQQTHKQILKEENKGDIKMGIDIYSNEKSPCSGCDHKDRDKNHEDCVSCDLRIKYMSLFNNLPELKVHSDCTKTLLSPPSKPVDTKICRGSLCKKINPKGIVHPFEKFGKNKHKIDGLQAWCKKCRADSVARSRRSERQKMTDKFTVQPATVITFRSKDDIFKETLKKLEELKTFHQKELEKIDVAILAIKDMDA